MWGSLALWNQDHKWYVSVGPLIGLLATVFLCCQTAMLNKHLLWDKVINVERSWLQPVSAASSNHRPPSHTKLPGPPPASFGPFTWSGHGEVPTKLFQGILVSYDWSSPILGISSLQVQAKSFPWQALSRLLKWSWTERLNFGQLELFPPLLNHWKTTCLPCLSPSHLSFIF